jgi:hypothetical protein
MSAVQAHVQHSSILLSASRKSFDNKNFPATLTYCFNILGRPNAWPT